MSRKSEPVGDSARDLGTDGRVLPVDPAASSVASRATRGAIRLILRTFALQGMQVVSSLVLARHLTPGAYGAFALASTLVGFGTAIGDIGVAESLVVVAHCDESDLGGSTTVATITAAISGAVLGLSGIALTSAILNPRDPALLTLIYAGTMVPTALAQAPTVRLRRALDFKSIGYIGFAGPGVGYVVQILLLIAGAGVWSLVWSTYANVVVVLLLTIHYGGGIPTPRFGHTVRRLLSRGWAYQAPIALSGATAIGFPILVAALLGSKGLGYWSWSNILATPVVTVLAILQTVLIPSLSQVFHRSPDRFRVAAEQASRVIALVSSIAALGLVGLTPDIVKLLFGQRWDPASGAVQIFAIAIIPMAFVQFLSIVVVIPGDPKIRLRCALIASAAAYVSIYPLVHFCGVVGAAASTGLVLPLVDSVLLAYAASIPLVRTGRNIVLGGSAVGAVSFAATAVLPVTPVGLVVAVLAVAVSAVAVAWTVDREVLLYVLDSVRSRSPAAAE